MTIQRIPPLRDASHRFGRDDGVCSKPGRFGRDDYAYARLDDGGGLRAPVRL
jgi:hypothetical protein